MKLVMVFNVQPVPKMRMTVGQLRLLRIPDHKLRSDKRPLVRRLRACMENTKALQWMAKARKFSLPESNFEIIFWIETNKSERWHTGHQQTPDVDNLCKQLFDALCASDAHIYNVILSKYWCAPGHGRIEIWK